MLYCACKYSEIQLAHLNPSVSVPVYREFVPVFCWFDQHDAINQKAHFHLTKQKQKEDASNDF